MKLFFLKRWLSYLTEIPLEKASTALNPSLNLSLRNGRFYLTTPNAVYSYGDLYKNFLTTFRKMDLGGRQNLDVLVLGFGLGSVPFILEKVFDKKYRYSGVEADSVVAFWAKKYLLPELESPVELHEGDAYEFVAHCEKQFDLVVMDVFLDDQVPVQFEREEFLENLRKCLKTNGLLIYNRLADTPELKHRATDFYDNAFRNIFPGATSLDLEFNRMLLSNSLSSLAKN